MKEIKAIIQSSALDTVLLALHRMRGLPGCTVSRILCYKKSDGGADERELEADERTKLEIVVKNSDAKKVVETILENARTGSLGDGKVFIMDCEDVVCIRTGEHGERAI